MRSSRARRPAPALAWAAGVVVLGLLGGCAAQQPSITPSATEPTLSAVTSITSYTQVSRPIDTYRPDTQELLALLNVETRKANDCLTTKSISGTYAPANQPALLAPFLAGLVADDVKRNSLWGFFDTDVENTSRYGYTRPPDLPGTLTSSVPAGADAAFQECLAQADKDLPSKRRVMSLADTSSLPNQGPAIPTTDSRWTAAVDKWAQCMKDAGFPDYTNPLDAIGDPKWHEDPSGKVSSEQISTASADISCKISTNLIGIGLAIQAAYDQEYVDKNRDALDAYKKQLDSYLAK